MKYLKQKLMAATSMMLVAVVMLSSSTYAWFAISTAPEVEDITVSMQTNQSLEIALGQGGDSADLEDYDLSTSTTDDGTYGGSITIADSVLAKATAGAAVWTSGTGLQTVTYDTDDGRPNGYETLSATEILTGYDVFSYESADSVSYAFGMGFFIRTNVDGNVTLTGSTVAVADDYATDVKVVLVPYTESVGSSGVYNTAGTPIELTLSKTSAGIYTLALPDGTTDLASSIDTDYYYELIVYLDGPSITNAEIATSASTIEIDLAFVNSAFSE